MAENLTPRVVVSVSGGKDSTATCLYLSGLGIKFDPIFMDVGWDNTETYTYLREYLPSVVGPITWLRQEVPLVEGYEDQTLEVESLLGISPSSMVRLCVQKGVFPWRIMRWCTESLKVVPAIQHFKMLKSENRVIVNAIGVRRQESRARAGAVEWEWSEGLGGILVWRPLADWTEDQVIAIHKKHNVRPNPNYLKGSSRVGCWPCIFSTKEEIRRIAETDPKRIKAIQMLEAVVAERARDRRERLGKPPMNAPSWFQNPSSEYTEDGRRDGSCWPIEKVVAWSKTARGGRQFELFTLPPSEEGCLRWGFCDGQGKGGDPEDRKTRQEDR